MNVRFQGALVAMLAIGCGGDDSADTGASATATDSDSASGSTSDTSGSATSSSPTGTATSDSSTSGGSTGSTGSAGTTAGSTSGTGSTGSGGSTSSGSTGSGSTGGVSPFPAVVVTFNTGTSQDLNHGNDGDNYGNNEADISDQYYGDGLAWQPAVDAATAYLTGLQPDVVVFQEMFYSENCAQIPNDKKAGFVCETWTAGDPTVAQVVVGEGYQVVCHLGKDDKCAAIKKSFGTFAGCTDDLCMDFLDGASIQDCGGGSRVGRGLIELAAGGEMTLVSYHGTSGLLPADSGCRVKQVEQIFVDFDGTPAADGARNLVMGDLNTDPYRAPQFLDPSAGRWLDFVDSGKAFEFISDAGVNAPPTYNNSLNIDHVISDVFTGTCVVPGVTQGHPEVYENTYFDHKPIVCTITE